MEKYTIYQNSTGQNIVQRLNEDGTLSFIPSDPLNSDYQQYLIWLEDN